jgi:hypothetical protein
MVAVTSHNLSECEAVGPSHRNASRRGRPRRSDATLLGDLMHRVEFDTNGGCWLWTKAIFHNGYGQFNTKKPGRTRRVHRLMFEEMRGSIPAGYELDHKCRVRICCNPDHLEPVTREENLRRGRAAHILNSKKTTCLRGHPFHTSDKGHRYCLECSRNRWAQRAAEVNARKRAQYAALRNRGAQ